MRAGNHTVTAFAQVSDLHADTITTSDVAWPSLAAPILIPNRTPVGAPNDSSSGDGRMNRVVDVQVRPPSPPVQAGKGGQPLQLRAYRPAKAWRPWVTLSSVVDEESSGTKIESAGRRLALTRWCVLRFWHSCSGGIQMPFPRSYLSLELDLWAAWGAVTRELHEIAPGGGRECPELSGQEVL
jgi:hypothetical protein